MMRPMRRPDPNPRSSNRPETDFSADYPPEMDFPDAHPEPHWRPEPDSQPVDPIQPPRPPRASSLLAALALLVIVILIAFGGTMLLLSRPQPAVIHINPPPATSTPAPRTPAPIVVYVTGAVQQPGRIYELPAGSRVADVIAAAGGFTDEADRARINMAAIARDEQQIRVPSVHDADDESRIATDSRQRVRINRASFNELQELPGVGPALAERILQHIDRVGPFSALAELDDVPGIGPATLEKWRDLIAFD